MKRGLFLGKRVDTFRGEQWCVWLDGVLAGSGYSVSREELWISLGSPVLRYKLHLLGFFFWHLWFVYLPCTLR